MEKPDCKKHIVPDYLKDLRQVAFDLGDMPYDKLGELFGHFMEKMDIDASNDKSGGREKVSSLLSTANLQSNDLKNTFEKLWKICEPYMK